jgi:glycosyltransferase involved in cell wall biosynthesis
MTGVESELARPLVVLPTYNEASNIGEMLQRLAEVLPTGTLLVVDDDSPDGTADVAEAASASFEVPVHVLRRAGKLGELSRRGNRYASGVLRLGVRDATAGFRAHRSSFIERLDLDAIDTDGYGFQVQLTYRARQASGVIVEVPIQFGERTRGDSKMSGRIILEALRDGHAYCCPRPAPTPLRVINARSQGGGRASTSSRTRALAMRSRFSGS